MTRDKIPGWPHDKLTVLAEQSSVFYDLMTPELLEQVHLRTLTSLTGSPTFAGSIIEALLRLSIGAHQGR